MMPFVDQWSIRLIDSREDYRVCFVVSICAIMNALYGDASVALLQYWKAVYSQCCD